MFCSARTFGSRIFLLCTAMLILAVALFAQNPPASNAPSEFVIKNATVLTATHGRIEHGSIYVKDGKIAAVGANVSAPSGVQAIDVNGAFVTPGIIDPH